MTTEEQQEIKEKIENKVECPCCHEKTLPGIVKPKQALLDEYMACMISGVPFWHEYSVYNGSVKVQCTTLTQNEKNKLKVVDTKLMEARKETTGETVEQIDSFRASLFTYAHIKLVNINYNGIVKTYTPKEHTVKLISEVVACDSNEALLKIIAGLYDRVHDTALMSAVPEPQLVAIVSANANVYQLLLDSGFDESFWAGIDLV